ncbi:MAG: DUF4083 family protein [Bacillota bacterium]
MYLFQAGYNAGDILFQLFMFSLFLGLPVAIILLIVVMRKRQKRRLDRIEEKLDRLLQEKD